MKFGASAVSGSCSGAALRPPLRRGAALVLVLLAGLTMLSTTALAHPLDPALLELEENSDGTVAVLWKISATRLPGTNVQPHIPEECGILDPAEITEEGTALVARWRVDCGDKLIGLTVGATGLAQAGTDALVRVRLMDGRVMRTVLGGDHAMWEIPERESRWQVGRGYAGLGVEHILTGFDHLLFVLGLLLLVGGGRLLLATITAFTVGHSITLSLAVLDIARVPSAPVEVLIAASVFVLAVELARQPPVATSLLRQRPWLMAGMFGLLHGLGFAGALREVGLPADEIPLSLFSFNVGIEVGQIAFVVALLILHRVFYGVIRRLPIWMERLPVYVMGCLAAMWMIERSLGLLA